MSDNAKIEGKDSEFLVIPLSRQRLGNFLTSLLGQPQSIDRKRFGRFDVDLEWIRNLVDTVNLRVTRQAKAKRISFSAEIGYSDGEVRTLSSYEELVAYNELFPRFTIRVKVRFSYLIEFPDKENPEREDFELVVDGSPSEQEKSGSVLSGILQKEQGMICYRIYYTERTWGDDLDKIFSEYLDKVFKKSSKVSAYGRIAFVTGSMMISALCLYLPMIFQLLRMVEDSNHLVDKLTKTFTDSTNWKIDYLYKIASQKHDVDSLSIVPTIVALVASIAIMVLATYISKKSGPSFVCLTEGDIGYRKKILDGRALRWCLAVIGYLLSLAGGVASNFIYKFLTEGSL